MLKLRDQQVNNNLICIVWQIRRLRKLLGKKKDLPKSPMTDSLKMIHEQLRL